MECHGGFFFPRELWITNQLCTILDSYNRWKVPISTNSFYMNYFCEDFGFGLTDQLIKSGGGRLIFQFFKFRIRWQMGTSSHRRENFIASLRIHQENSKYQHPTVSNFHKKKFEKHRDRHLRGYRRLRILKLPCSLFERERLNYLERLDTQRMRVCWCLRHHHHLQLASR